uniref:HTH cro/C1-type domain-containing protein n=1 Tax=uncultured bacterium fosmid pJB39A3 TaxID=1478063 RepID=A0A0H3UAF7_9BACT|nr:hypothetical protein [uncultured bacterium fosmid pJB39A3]
MSIGSNISKYRKAMGMTQMKLAEEVGVSFQAISSWERDEYYPDTDNVIKLCRVLKAEPNKILGEDKEHDYELHDRLFDENHMYTFIKSWTVANDMPQTLKALSYAKEKHAGQVRKGDAGIPYINHPLTLCCNAIALGIKDDAIMAACLLHDVVEDAGVTADELPVGDEAKRIVALLTKEKQEGKAFDEGKYYAAIAKSPAACMVKLLDRCNNISNMAMGFNKEKIAQYITETEKYIMPLLEVIKKENAEWNNAAWLLSYQMKAILETNKRYI